MRSGPFRVLLYAGLVVFGLLLYLGNSSKQYLRTETNRPSEQPSFAPHHGGPAFNTDESDLKVRPADENDTSIHPVARLIRENEQQWNDKIAGQSKTLAEAVKVYRARYKIHPPPKFDAWFHFAKKRKVQIIDDYDTIHHDLLPFWGLQPSTLRARVREALGEVAHNAFTRVCVRNGAINDTDPQGEWDGRAIIGMMSQFTKYLPDMDIAFNKHDEPRVVVPHDDIARLIKIATEITRAAAASKKDSDLRTTFSERPADVTKDGHFEILYTTRFNEYAHQPTWVPGTLSCPPDSPARALDSEQASDDTSCYATGELGFIYNRTAFTDVCNSPSLANTHAAFQRPNAFVVAHQLFPVFSQSKLSSYNDILYPSPWYWANRAVYVPERDTAWATKNISLWWVGSTTGGYSRAQGWKNQHRQRLVSKINAKDSARIMVRAGHDANPRRKVKGDWQVKTVDRTDLADLMNVHFTKIEQCDKQDCEAQAAHFDVMAPQDFQSGWQYKFLLDMDGNAFSGRFYSFLRSKSLPLKMAMFREWHEEWIRPWVHYVPLTLGGEEVLETVRYFATEEQGKIEAERLASQGRIWAESSLRKDDLEVWFFRLLLEYARVIDDNRENIGFVL